MPKRKNQDKIKYYLRKLQKVEREQKTFRRIIYSSSSDDSDQNSDINPDSLDVAPVEQSGSNQEQACNPLDTVPVTTGQSEPAPEPEPVPAPETEPILELDTDILTALGETTDEAPRFGPKIHEKLSQLWLPILRKGMNKEVKEKLMKEYVIPENCPLLQAPKLNPEISAAVAEGTRTKDKRVEAVQQQLGQGITALNKGLELLLDNDSDRIRAVKYISDSCRILCDLHFTETEARKKFVTPGLDKSFLNIIQNVDRDEMLFGGKLSENIKATKIIEKHGLQIKKPAATSRPQSYQQPSTSRPRPQGNWTGPSRYPSNRGGRGGQRGAPPPPARRANTSSAAPRKPQNKQSATTPRQ